MENINTDHLSFIKSTSMIRQIPEKNDRVQVILGEADVHECSHMWWSDAQFGCKVVIRPSTANQMERNWVKGATVGMHKVKTRNVCFAKYLN